MHNIEFTRTRMVDDWIASVIITVPGIYHYECGFDGIWDDSKIISGSFLVVFTC